MVHHRLFCQYKHHQLGNRLRTFVENGKQKGIQLSGKPMYEPGNENAQDQYHQRRFSERFASGINERTYTVSLSRGIIDKLNDQELEAVIAHELSHIRNKDVRLMIVSIVFVGIFAMLAQMAMRSVYYSSMSRRRDEKTTLRSSSS